MTTIHPYNFWLHIYFIINNLNIQPKREHTFPSVWISIYNYLIIHNLPLEAYHSTNIFSSLRTIPFEVFFKW